MSVFMWCHGISWAQGLSDWCYREIHISMALGDD